MSERIEIRQIGQETVELSIPGQGTREIHADDSPEIIEQLAARFEVRVYDRGRFGYRANIEIIRKATELAGLESFQAAKQLSQGYIDLG